jgi:LemA protein
MKTSLIVILLVIVIVLGVKYIGARNGLVAEREGIDAAWAQVDAALTQRAELIPDLVETVQSGAPAAQAAIESVKQARSDLVNARGPEPKIRANNHLDTALARMLLAVENYPQLEHSKKFAGLEDALKESEDHIAVERRKYNEAVEHYNTQIALFPNNIVASVSRFNRIDTYFQTPLGDTEPAPH